MKIKNGRETNGIFRNKFSGILEWSDGGSPMSLEVRYYKDGFLHNENGLAIIGLTHDNNLWACNGFLFSEESIWKFETEKLKKNRKNVLK